ncbi:MAG: hypothetical protein HYU43_07075, partial [Armatimonadetes bacterium]|nr:hypothetical protein [Armatimonadota bacterium]
MGIPVISLRSKATASAPAWMIGAVTLVVELVLVLAIMTAASYRYETGLYNRLSAQEPLLDLLHNASTRIVLLTGRPGASVRLIYDSAQKRG